jgi:hypothetical protein
MDHAWERDAKAGRLGPQAQAESLRQKIPLVDEAGRKVIRHESDAAALERYSADYQRHSMAAEVATASIASLSKSISAAEAAMAHFAFGSPAWRDAKKEAEDAFLGAQQLSVYYPTTPERENNRRTLLAAQEAKSGMAHLALRQIEATAEAAAAPIRVQYQALEAAKATEARERVAASFAAANMIPFAKLRKAAAEQEEKRLKEISRMLAAADMKKANDTIRSQKIIALTGLMSVTQDVAEAVFKHLLSPKAGKFSLVALQAINRYASENQISFQDAEIVLSE